MKKSERLFYLLHFLNNSDKASLEEIARCCDISERTVYRDIRALIKLGFQVEFNDGYQLNQMSRHPVFDKLNAIELRLIRFALETHPLGKFLPLGALAEHFDRSSAQFSKTSSPENRDSLFLLEDKARRQNVNLPNRIVTRFIQATVEKRKVKINSGSPNASAKTHVPLAIKIRESNVYLLFSSDDSQNALELPIEHIHNLEISSEFFERRPIELIDSDLVRAK